MANERAAIVINAVRIATVPACSDGSMGQVSYWQHGDNIYRLNEYEPVQFDIYGLPLGARWECSRDHFDAWRNVLVPGEETALDRAMAIVTPVTP